MADQERESDDSTRDHEEATRLLRALRVIHEQRLEVGYDHDKRTYVVGLGEVCGYGESPAEALFHYHDALEGRAFRAYPWPSYSLRDLPAVERARWSVSLHKGQVEELQRQVAELHALRTDGAVRVLDGCGVDLDGLADEQAVLMTAATLRDALHVYRSPAVEKAERERLDAAFPGLRQISGPDREIGLPPYYRLDRRVYEGVDGTARQEWSPSAIDPGDLETMGFCGYDDPKSAAAECRRHAERVRADATGVELTPQWSASTIEAFWYRWLEERDGDSTKLTTADFVRDLCAAVKS